MPDDKKELDAAAKVILLADPRGIARVALGGTDIEVLGTEETEFPTLRRRTDKVRRVRVAGQRELVRLHVEVQAVWKSDVPWRVLEYRTRIRREFPRVESLVLVLRRDDRRGRPRGRYRETSAFGGTLLDFRFHVVCAWQLDAEELLHSEEPGLLPLVPFARGADRTRVMRAVRLLERVPDRRSRADLVAALEIFALRAFKDVPWSAIIPRRYAMASSFWNEAWQGGVAEGKRQGRAEGEAKGTARVLAALIREKLGRARAAPYVPRLEACDAEAVEKLVKLTMRQSGDALVAALDEALPTPTSCRARRRKA